jgi:translation initiation factor IF-2
MMTENSAANLKPRPPVVVVLGHVDHGKTTFLDYIRKTNVAGKEAGAITQHLGAYQAKLKIKNEKLKIDEEKTITFLDTPGHEAFAKMRSRGARIADLAILVISAEDGVMPQTKESIQYINEEKIPFLVAINKIDLPGVSAEKVKSQLVESGIFVEGYGGKIVSVPVSAKSGVGIEQLLEMIFLLAEMEELRADPGGPFLGVVIEAKLDRSKGPLATILVKEGTLRLGDQVEIEGKVSKVKAMFGESGQDLLMAGPSMPVEVLGLGEVPVVGAMVKGKEDQISQLPVARETVRQPLVVQEETEKKLKIILKADVAGSLEAISACLPAEGQVILAGIGDVSESDVLLAKTTGAQIFGFGVKVPVTSSKLAQEEKVKIASYKIIYELLENVQNQVLKMLEPTLGEEVLGKAKIIAEFTIDKQRIAGARVLEGKISQGGKVHLRRKEKAAGDSQIVSLKHQKEDIKEAGVGTDFGAIFSPSLDFQIGDSIIAYK